MENTETILDRLVRLYPQAKKTTLREMVEGKRVRLNGAPVKSLKQPIVLGDKVEIVGAEVAQTRAADLAEGLRMVHYDADVVIVDKPTGLLTSTDAAEKRPTALRVLTQYFRKQNSKNQIYLVHRLDRDASGLLVFARNSGAYRALKDQFLDHTISRRYDVVAHGVPKNKQGRLENLLQEDKNSGEVRVTKDAKAGKVAIMEYALQKTDADMRLSHIQCTLFTGRKHQIRAQLKAAGLPVCGDPVYGNAQEPPGRLALHASHLAFDHPRSGRRIKFESAMPGSFGHLVRA